MARAVKAVPFATAPEPNKTTSLNTHNMKKLLFTFLAAISLAAKLSATTLGIQRTFNEVTSSDYSQLLMRVLQQQNLSEYTDVKLISHYSQNKQGSTLNVIIGVHRTVITLYKGTQKVAIDTFANRYSELYTQIENRYPAEQRDTMFWRMFIEASKKVKRKQRIPFYEAWKNKYINQNQASSIFKKMYGIKITDDAKYDYELNQAEFTFLVNRVLQLLQSSKYNNSTLLTTVYNRSQKEKGLLFYSCNPGGNYVAKAEPFQTATYATGKYQYSSATTGTEVIPGLLTATYKKYHTRGKKHVDESTHTTNFYDIRKQYIKNLFNTDLATGTQLVIDSIPNFQALISPTDPGNTNTLYFPMANTSINRQPGDAALLNMHLYGHRILPLNYTKVWPNKRVEKNRMKLMNSSLFPKKLHDYLLYNVANPAFNRTGTAYNYIIAANEYFQNQQQDQAAQVYLSAYLKATYSDASNMQKAILKDYVTQQLIKIYTQRNQPEYVDLLKFNSQLLQLQALHPYNVAEHIKKGKNEANTEIQQAVVCDRVHSTIITLALTSITVAANIASLGATLGSVARAASEAVNATLSLVKADLNRIGNNIRMMSESVNTMKEAGLAIDKNIIMDYQRDLDTFDIVWKNISMMTTQNIIATSQLISKHTEMQVPLQKKFANLLANYLYPNILSTPDYTKITFGSGQFTALVSKFRDYEKSVFLSAYFGIKKKPNANTVVPNPNPEITTIKEKDFFNETTNTKPTPVNIKTEIRSSNNFWNEDVPVKSQTIEIAETTQPDVKEPVTITIKKPIFHTVVQGETLYRLALLNNVTVEDLTQWNDVRNGIKPGMILMVGYTTTTVPEKKQTTSSNTQIPTKTNQNFWNENQ